MEAATLISVTGCVESLPGVLPHRLKQLIPSRAGTAGDGVVARNV
jgi:hypothetical protein